MDEILPLVHSQDWIARLVTPISQLRYAVSASLTPNGTTKGSFVFISILLTALEAEILESVIWKERRFSHPFPG